MGPDELRDYLTEVYNDFSAFPEQGEPGRLYVDISQHRTYVWSDNNYVAVSNTFLHYVDSMPRYHTHLSLPNMTDTEFAPLNFDTPPIVPINTLFQDTDGDAHTIIPNVSADTTTYAAEGFITNYVNDAIQSIRIGNLDLSDPESFYDFLKMWPLYNDSGQVIGLFYSKELRDQAKEQLELKKLAPKKPVNRLKELLKKSTS